MLGQWLIVLAVDAVRYLVAASGAFFLFWVWGRERFRRRLIPPAFPRVEKLIHDMKWSASTVVVFSLIGVTSLYAGRAGILRRYPDVSEYGVAYLAFSVVLLIVLQDTYFYWTHRAMHHPLLYRWFHRIHHASTSPSPWTAYAFSPLEAAVHAAFVPLLWFFVPLHEAAVFLFMIFMLARNVLGHLSMELYPSGFTRGAFWGWHTTTTHHGLHHQHFRTNYGLYFTFWDRLMGTTHARYHEEFERVAGR